MNTLFAARNIVVFVVLLYGVRSVAACGRNAIPDRSRHPVVFVPGIGGSIIQARRRRPVGKGRRRASDATLSSCPHYSGWYRMWLCVSSALRCPSCFANAMTLRYDNATSRYANSELVSATRVAYFGSMNAVNDIDRHWLWKLSGQTAYALRLTRLLVQLGYHRDEDLVSAPYDFRYAPSSHGNYFFKLKRIVERIYSTNGLRRVVLLTHSFGGIMTHRFLVEYVTTEWRNKYVECWVPVAVPWAGSVESLYRFTTGLTSGKKVLDRTLLANMIRSWESTVATLPVPGVLSRYNGTARLIVRVGHHEYTTNDVAEFVKLVAGVEASDRYLDKVRIPASLRHPGVNVRVAVSSGIPTVEKFEFPVHRSGAEFLSAIPKVTYGNGDGTVNEASLMASKHWGATTQFIYKVYTKHGAKHQEILSSDVMAQIIIDINRK